MYRATIVWVLACTAAERCPALDTGTPPAEARAPLALVPTETSARIRRGISISLRQRGARSSTLSADGGKTWRFVDGEGLTPRKIRLIAPSYAGPPLPLMRWIN
jgi:hypothetical protein